MDVNRIRINLNVKLNIVKCQTTESRSDSSGIVILSSSLGDAVTDSTVANVKAGLCAVRQSIFDLRTMTTRPPSSVEHLVSAAVKRP